MKMKVPPENCCEPCRHFFRHYTKGKDKYYATAFGHCSKPRIKVRRLWDGCPRWAAEQKESAGH